MPAPVITLTTDFGLSDHYVGAMKGVILGICPEAQFVDISHQVKPFAVADAAYLIAQSHPCFSKGTVHIVVVDPGVGTSRRPILVENYGQFFIGPDNGVFGMLYDEGEKVRAITAERYFRRPVSKTFHGRDIFAPIAGQVANGIVTRQLGDPITDYVRPEFLIAEQTPDGGMRGCVLHVDHFGNIVTNIPSRRLVVNSPNFALQIGDAVITKYVETYAEANSGEVFALTGSAGYLEVSMNKSAAVEVVKCAALDRVTLKI